MYMFFGGAVAFLIIVGSAFTLGGNYVARKCNAAALTAQIEQLRTQLAATKAAAQADAKALADSVEETETLRRASLELEGKISQGVCFPDGPDADGVRKLWGTVTVRPARATAR